MTFLNHKERSVKLSEGGPGFDKGGGGKQLLPQVKEKGKKRAVRLGKNFPSAYEGRGKRDLRQRRERGFGWGSCSPEGGGLVDRTGRILLSEEERKVEKGFTSYVPRGILAVRANL